MELSESARITQTKQLNRLDDLTTRQSTYSNEISLPKTSKNKKALDFLGEPGSLSRKPYQVAQARLVLDSMEMINNGRAMIEETTDSYNIKVYDGIINLFTAIEGKSIKDLDWSDLDHVATPQLVVDSMDGSQEYIYTLYGTATNLQVTDVFQRTLVEYMLPNVYEYAIFDRILTQAGFTYEGEIFDTDEFKSIIVGAVTTDSEELDLTVKKIGSVLPDISQADFIREVIWRYGLTFKREQFTDKYVFKQLKNTIVDKENALNWSSRFHNQKGITHRLGKYAKSSKFTYAGQSNDADTKNGEITVDIDTISASVDLINSKYWCNVVLTDGYFIDHEIFKFKENTDEYEVKIVKPWIFKIENDPDPSAETQITNRDFSTSVTTSIRHYARFKELNWQKFINDNYRQIKEIANHPNVHTITVELTSIDFYTLDLFKIVFIEQLGSYFYINKVGPYKDDQKLTSAELVQIPASAFIVGTDADQDANQPPSVQIDATPSTVDEYETITLNITATDPEGSFDDWYILKNGAQWMSGQGAPPSVLTYEPLDTEVGSLTFLINVQDAGGLSAQDSDTVQVSEVDNIQLDNSTGILTGPAGASITIQLSTTGFTYANAELWVSEDDTITPGQEIAVLNTCIGESANNCPVDQGPNVTRTFTMPSNGMVYLIGTQYPGTDGSQAANASYFTVTYLQETESGSFSEGNPYPN